MKRPLYHLLCAIACASMVSSTMPMAAIAEAVQPQATADQKAQADTSNGNAGKAEDGANTNAAADTVVDSTATSAGTSAANPESADGTAAGLQCLRHRCDDRIAVLRGLGAFHEPDEKAAGEAG